MNFSGKSISSLFWLSLSLLVLVWPSVSMAQTGNTSDDRREEMDLILTPANINLGQPFDLRYEGVRGSPFLFEEWLPGSLVTTDSGKVIPMEGININTYKQTLWVQAIQGTVGKIPLDRVREIRVKNNGQGRLFRLYSTQAVEQDKQGAPKIYEVLHDGTFTLLKAHDKKFIKASYKGPYSPDRRYDEFKAEPRWYLKDEEGRFQRLKPGIKRLGKLLPSYKKQIRQLADEQDWNLKEDSDLARLLDRLEDP